MMFVGLKTLRFIPSEWLDIVSLSLAVTLFLTIRSLLSVFRQRTGDLVRPLPWNIVVPLVTGRLC